MNEGRKAGNVAEFCAVYGAEYDFMIVLDADSLMTGPAMRRLARLMEENPGLGLVQTVSYATGRDTLFARVQQFAVRLYAPLALRCLETWQGPDGATGATTRSCGSRPSPPIAACRCCRDGAAGRRDPLSRHGRGRAPAPRRLRGAAPPRDGRHLGEMPTNLVDLVGRERRWCQGNLQHLGVIGLPGLAGASRAHLGTGILAYLMAPLWVGFLALGTAQAIATGRLGLLAYGLADAGAAGLGLGLLALAIFAAPKVLSLAHVLADPGRRQTYGGAGRLLIGAALEQALWWRCGRC